MQPKVSVIVAVYNAEKTLHRCLDSLVGQELTDIEIILVDDGSTDRSGAICDTYAAEDARIKVVHKQNEGVSATKQLGLDIAVGQYFIFMDSDDYADKTAYRKLFECAEKEDADIACCDLYRIESDGLKREGYMIPSFKHEVFLNGILDILNGYLANRLIRKSLVGKYRVRFPQGLSFGEDKTFLVDLLSKSLKAGETLTISYVPEALIYYDKVINPNSLMKLDVKPKLDARIRLWEAMGRNLDLDRFGKTYYRSLVKHAFTAFWKKDLSREEFEYRYSKYKNGIRRFAPRSSYTCLVLLASSGRWNLAQKMRWLAYGRILSEKLALTFAKKN